MSALTARMPVVPIELPVVAACIDESGRSEDDDGEEVERDELALEPVPSVDRVEYVPELVPGVVAEEEDGVAGLAVDESVEDELPDCAHSASGTAAANASQVR